MFFVSEPTIRTLKNVALTIFSIKSTQNIDFGDDFYTKSTKIHHFAPTPRSSNAVLYFFIKNQQKTIKNSKNHSKIQFFPQKLQKSETETI